MPSSAERIKKRWLKDAEDEKRARGTIPRFDEKVKPPAPPDKKAAAKGKAEKEGGTK